MQPRQQTYRRLPRKGQEPNGMIPQPRREWHTIDSTTLSSRTDQLLSQDLIAARISIIPQGKWRLQHTPLPPHHRALMPRLHMTNALTDRTVTIGKAVWLLKIVRRIIPMTGRVSNFKAVAGTRIVHCMTITRLEPLRIILTADVEVEIAPSGLIILPVIK